MWFPPSVVFLSFVVLLFVLPPPSTAKPKKWQVQLNRETISEHNDTVYVRRVMQLAKSAEMRSYLDESTDVCDNFYEFACGNWPKINPADAQHNFKTNFFSLLIENYNQLQLNLLRTDNTYDQAGHGDAEVETDYLWKIRSFFRSCLRSDNTQHLRKELRRIIDEFGSMPALLPPGTWKDEDFDWIETLARIQNKYGIDIIVSLAIYRDFLAKNNVTKIFIAQTGLALETKSMYFNEESELFRSIYKRNIRHNLEDYLQVPHYRLEDTVNDIFNFELELSRGLSDFREEKSHNNWNLRTLEYLNATYGPTIDFEKYLTTALGMPFNDTVYEILPEYQQNLVKIVTSTPKQHLANYIMYQLINEFIKNVQNTRPHEKEKTCLQKTKVHFDKPLDRLAYLNFGNKDTKHDVELMWEKLKTTFKSELDANKFDWMTEKTKDLAIEKLHDMQLKINVYEELNFTAEYLELDIRRNHTFLDNIKAVMKFDTKRGLEKLHEAPDSAEMPDLHKTPAYLTTEMPGMHITPVYITTENLIRIPVVLLQPNFLWSDHYPEALRYGTLGFLLAHELIHGFDDRGRNFDAKGNHHMWWDTNTTEAFVERRKCLQYQYRRYRYGGKYLPESELQTENLADNAAIQLAYCAYVNFLEEIQKLPNEQERAQILEMEQLPYLNYNNRQLFFVSYAQFWCFDINEKLKNAITLNDSHAPAMFRVIGPLANFDEFSKVFHCPPDVTMNPPKKCRIY